MTRSLVLALAALICGCSHPGAGFADLGGDEAPDGATAADAGSADGATADLATGPISITPDPLDFGSVVNKTTTTLPLTISNPGTVDITITSATASGPGFSVDVTSLPMTLAAGATMTLMVSFAPTIGGSATGTLSITHDGADSPAMVPLSGVSVHVVALAWTASVSTDVTGYNIYRGTTAGGPYPLKVNAMSIAGTAFSDPGVASCASYYYVATAIGAASAESGYSNEAAVAIPCP